LIIASGVAGLLSLALLLVATRNTEALSAGLPWLIGLNAALLLLAASLVVAQLRELVWRRRSGAFGSRLMTRLVLLFSLMAVLPGALVYGASVFFLRSSIDSWFDVRIERAIDGGLSLGRGAVGKLLDDLHRRGVTLALDIAESSPTEYFSRLSEVVDRAAVREAILYDTRGNVVMVVGGRIQQQVAPAMPVTPLLVNIRAQRQYSTVQTDPAGGLVLRSLYWVTPARPGQEPRVLELQQPVPSDIAADADKVETGWAEYQSLTLARSSLKRLFLLSLTLALGLAGMVAVAIGIYLADRLSTPLAQLGLGTAAVAEGDLSVQLRAHERDELGSLAGSFNRMTQQLREARADLIDQQATLAATNAYLQALLENLSSGVLVFGRDLLLRSSNALAAERIGLPGASTAALNAALRAGGVGPGALGTALQAQMAGTRDHWTLEHRLSGKQGERVLLLRGSPLEDVAEAGHVVVFDDITDVVQAQRDIAWAEVARRLAHEIKNPLMPIRLSAERLEHKLAPRLASADAELLHRATATIVNQVDAMKAMVRDFADFARPAPTRAPELVDLAALIEEVLDLYGELEPILERRIEAGLPTLQGHPTELRQVLHNLLANAKDALEGEADPHLRLDLCRAGGGMELAVTDNGAGFPEALITRAFEPYTTTKEKGTGLGLAIVRKVVESHGGRVSIGNVEPHGAYVRIFLPVEDTV
jgi:nitrogen fixation/metabolism regulation signal transduction histidine kinase